MTILDLEIRVQVVFVFVCLFVLFGGVLVWSLGGKEVKLPVGLQ